MKLNNILLTIKVLVTYSSYLIPLLILRILGMVLIPIGLIFKKDLNVESPYTQYPELGNWKFVILPKWLRLFNNIVDGVNGDRRGWYHNELKDKSEFFRQWWWTAVRNPTNYLSRFILSVEVNKITVKKIYGQDKVDNKKEYFGIQLLEATNIVSGKKYYHFQYCTNIPFTKKCVMFRVGYKFDLKDNDKEYEPLVKNYDTILAEAIRWRSQPYLSDSPIENYKGFTVRIFPVIKDY